MQPNANRPVYTVQPSNVTHLNIRPTTITSGVQQVQPPPQLVYQISTVRQPTLAQPVSTPYQVQPQQQPRLVTASPVYGALQAQRFATSPKQIVTPTASISPRLITPQAGSRLTMVTAPTASTTLLRSAGPSMIPSPIPPTVAAGSPAPAPAAQPAAPGTKEFAVKIPKTRARYGIMEFASGLSIDVKDWKAIEMRREINPYTYRAPSNVDPNGPSSTTITTSLGAVLPKTGAGSEYGREQKEALKRKRYAVKGTNIEDLPWVLTDRSSSEKKLKHYRGLKKGGVTTNSSYYVFIQGKDGFEAYPVEDWHGFSPTNVYKTLEFDEAEKQYQERHKNLSKWFLKHQAKNENGAEEDADGEKDKGKKTAKKGKRDFKLLDSEDWIHEEEENEEDDDDEDGDVKDKSGKKSKSSKKDSQKNKGAWNLSDEDDDDEGAKRPAKKAKRRPNEDQKEDSDDGDKEGYEVEYSSDESSNDEDDRDLNTAETTSKYEIKGVDEEVRNMPDIEKKLEQMDDNGGEIDFFDDDDEEDVPEIEENEDENGKAPGDDIGDVGTLLNSDAISKEMESSSDDDDMDDSDDPDKDVSESATAAPAAQQLPLEQVKTEKGHKKAREEEMRAIKSQVMSLPAIPPNPNETITEEKVRNLLQRRQQMTVTEIIQSFLPKADHLRTNEIKEGIVKRLATVLNSPSFETKSINNTRYIKLK